MHGIVNPSGMTLALFELQGGLCFHCGFIMILIRKAGDRKDLQATREHIYPKATSGKGMRHNVVIAHYRCNHLRGCPPRPSEDEIYRTIELYGKLGLEAFIQPADWNRWPKYHLTMDAIVSDVAGNAMAKWKEKNPSAFPTIADVWPR